MAAAAHAALGERIQASLVSGPRGAVNLPDAAEWMASAHPLPDDSSVRAGARALAIARDAKSAGDPLLVLLSGGGSSMLCAPAAGISLADKRAVVEALMRRGADIGQVNCVRTHLSAIKGGRLAAAAGRSVTLAISDVHDPEDDPATIASGPTFGNGTRPADALAVLDSLQIPAPASVRSHLLSGNASSHSTPGPMPGSHHFRVVGNRRLAMQGAVRRAAQLGYRVHVEEAPSRGEAREAGRQFAERALAQSVAGEPTCVIASGETTVKVVGDGRGGRNQEFALGAAPLLARSAAVLLASAGTDGIDGPTDAAGAIVTTTTIARAAAAGVDIARALARNDAYKALARLGDLIITGPTGTNVGDLHILLTAVSSQPAKRQLPETQLPKPNSTGST
jgi:glycerate 2-kinase